MRQLCELRVSAPGELGASRAPAHPGGAATVDGGTPAALRLTVEVPGDPSAVRVAEPVTLGVPLPSGMCVDERRLSVAGNAGPVPVQSNVLERWPDGSIRWALLDFQANAPAAYDVRVTPAPSTPVDGLVVREHEGAAEVESCGLRFRVDPKGGFCLTVRGLDGRTPVRRVTIDLTRQDGALLHPDVSSIEWEMIGVLRSVLRVGASIGSDSRNALSLVVRLHFYAGSSTVRFEVTVANPARAEHPGGFWELGDAGSVLIRDCSVRVETGAPTSIRFSADVAQPLETVSLPFVLYQDSSGGENWQSTVHVNRDGVVPVSFRGYRLETGGETRAGHRATPVLWTDDGCAKTGVAVRHFWQNSPKGLEADTNQIVLRLFPRQFADLHEIQGGEQKTQVFHVAFGEDLVSVLPLDWTRRPALATASPEWYSAAGAVPYLTPASGDPHPAYVDLVNSIVEGSESFERRRELIDEYGWRNFGDIYADHEAAYYTGPLPIVSHYNNQYDAIAGFAYQFLRSRDARWWHAMEELAWHVRDIDIYHTADDKAAYSGGLFWHTAHYVDAGRSSHRSYPKAKGVCGGGPANEHTYSTGLMLHYLLTGEPASRDAAIGLAEWVLRIDDGRRTTLGWVSRADTGLASATYSPEFHGPGRGAGNAIVVLLNGYRLTGRAVFLEKAETLILRCVHPTDDLEALGLSDPESRWSYTVFLQSLGRYLDEKIIRGELDDRYTYARASLLHYARWMASAEYPYLDKPEGLEYPTETWAAQDMRKSDVFKFAVKHAEDTERGLFTARAHFFFHAAMRQLGERPTRFSARPRVILTSCGFMHAAFTGDLEQWRAPGGNQTTDFGERTAFSTQKSVVRQQIRRVVLAGLLVTTAIVGIAAAWL